MLPWMLPFHFWLLPFYTSQAPVLLSHMELEGEREGKEGPLNSSNLCPNFPHTETQCLVNLVPPSIMLLHPLHLCTITFPILFPFLCSHCCQNLDPPCHPVLNKKSVETEFGRNREMASSLPGKGEYTEG